MEKKNDSENRKRILIGTSRPGLLRFLTEELSLKGYKVIMTINEFEGVTRLANEQFELAIFERSMLERAVQNGIAHALGAYKTDVLICLVAGKDDFNCELRFKNTKELPENPGLGELNEVIAALTADLAA